MTENIHYDFSKCRELFESAPRNDKDFTEAVKYFHDRCFYTDSGSVYVYKKNKLEYFSKEEFERVQMIGFGPELKKAIAKKIIPYEEVLNAEHFEVDKEGRRVNSLKAMNVTKLRNVEVGKKGLNYVEFFKNYLLDVIANKNVSLCDYILKWLSNVIKLKKNKTALIIVSSTEGIGKSSLTKVMEKIIGKDLVTYPSLSSLSKFNFQCYGKLIVCLEETEGLRQNEGALNDNLKNLTANDTFPYEAKGIQPKDLKNVNNVMASSNFSLNVAGRRYINITPSTKWLNRDDLFDQLYDLDDENIKALYDFLLSIDTTGFNEEKEGKKLVMGEGNLKEIEKMNNAWKFMKDFYALDKLSERIKPINLYEKYKQTGIKNIYNKSMSKIVCFLFQSCFRTKMTEICFIYYYLLEEDETTLVVIIV